MGYANTKTKQMSIYQDGMVMGLLLGFMLGISFSALLVAIFYDGNNSEGG
jgi:hypothetical protein